MTGIAAATTIGIGWRTPGRIDNDRPWGRVHSAECSSPWSTPIRRRLVLFFQSGGPWFGVRVASTSQSEPDHWSMTGQKGVMLLWLLAEGAEADCARSTAT
jgi:hypothetical protein